MSETRGLTLDPSCPVDWAHPLNAGLVGDWTPAPLPGWSGGLTLRDLVRGGRRPNDGTLTNGPTWVGGPHDGFRALNFDGVDDYVDIADDPVWDANYITLSCWFRTTATATRALLDRDDEGSSRCWQFRCNSPRIEFIPFVGGSPLFANGTSNPIDGRWHHAAATYDGATARVYVDGLLEGSAAGAGVMSPGTIGPRFGRRRQGDSQFGGAIADWRFYSRALSAAAIYALYDQRRRDSPDLYRWLRPWSFGVAVAGGGTTYPESLAGSLTASGTLTRVVSKAVAGSETGSGAVAFASAKPFGGTSTATAALANLCAKPLAGSSTTSGALTRQPLKAMAGSATPAGAAAKAVAKPLAASCAATAGVTRTAAKALAGSSQPTGAEANAVAKPLAGDSTPTGALSTAGVKVTSAGGSLTAAGVVASAAAKALTGDCTPAGAAANATAKAMGAEIAPAGAVTRAVGKPVGGSATPTGDLSRVRATLLAVGGALAAAGALVRAVAKALAGLVTGAGSLATEGGSEPPPAPTIVGGVFRRLGDLGRLFGRGGDLSRVFRRGGDLARVFRGFPRMAGQQIQYDTRPKDASEAIAFVFDFSRFPEVVAGGELTSPVVDPVSGLTIGAAAVTDAAEVVFPNGATVAAGKGVKAAISGGTAGTTYALECRATIGGSVRVVKGSLAVE